MTILAFTCKLRRRVVRVPRPVEIRFVALEAVRICQVVIAVHVTALARFGLVRAFQRKLRLVMLERRGSPCKSAVTRRAIMIELRHQVVRCLRFVVIVLVALEAIGIPKVVIAVDVAALAGLLDVRSFQWKLRRRMIEGRRLPSRGGMANGTIPWELPLLVIWLADLVEVFPVAVVTILGQGDTVRAVEVTLLTVNGPVLACQRETGFLVIEPCRFPRFEAVANRTVAVELPLHVIRFLHGGVVVLMTAPAIEGRAGVLPACMALLAVGAPVRALQREPGRVVIERCGLPRGGGVTHRAIPRKRAPDVVGFRRTPEVAFVAAPAVQLHVRVITVAVALLARKGFMGASQREFCLAVFEGRRFPRGRRVTRRTRVRELPRLVIRVDCAGVILLVTLETIRVGNLVIATDVAISARRIGMLANQRKSRGRMIERRGFPSIHRMATKAIMTECSGGMIRVAGGIEVIIVTGITIHRSAAEHLVDVALPARNRHVLSDEREPCLVVVDCGGHRLHRLPGFCIVAFLALLREPNQFVLWLRGVLKVCLVASLAFQRHPLVLTVDVALLAGSSLVRAGKAEVRVVVIERGGLPRGESVTGLTIL